MQPTGPVLKYAYNGLDEVTAEYETDGAGGSSYSAASSVASDTVLAQTEYSYDADANVIETIMLRPATHRERDRFAGTPTSGVAVRVSYSADYFDSALRLTASIDVGDNGGSALDQAPVRSRADRAPSW